MLKIKLFSNNLLRTVRMYVYSNSIKIILYHLTPNKFYITLIKNKNIGFDNVFATRNTNIGEITLTFTFTLYIVHCTVDVEFQTGEKFRKIVSDRT